MERIKLINPTKEYERQVLDFRNEFLLNGDSMNGTAGLRDAESFDEWLNAIEDNSSEETVRDDLAPASTYLAVRLADDKLVGMIDIRHRLNDYLYNYGGHLGYSVRKPERCKGYAKQMVSLALKKCKELNLDKILVSCDKENIASARTIISNGGVLENEVLEGEDIIQRYWIML